MSFRNSLMKDFNEPILFLRKSIRYLYDVTGGVERFEHQRELDMYVR